MDSGKNEIEWPEIFTAIYRDNVSFFLVLSRKKVFRCISVRTQKMVRKFVLLAGYKGHMTFGFVFLVFADQRKKEPKTLVIGI